MAASGKHISIAHIWGMSVVSRGNIKAAHKHRDDMAASARIIAAATWSLCKSCEQALDGTHGGA